MDTSLSFCQSKRHFLLILLASLALFSLSGCEKSNKQTLSAPQTIKKFDQATTLEGKVVNEQGPVKNGQVNVNNNQGQLITSTTLQNNDHYRVEIPANTTLPIILSFEDKLVSVVIDPFITKYDINPLTTAIAKKALSLGGYTRSNMVIAAEETVHIPDANKTSTGFRGDPTTQYGGWH